MLCWHIQYHDASRFLPASSHRLYRKIACKSDGIGFIIKCLDMLCGKGLTPVTFDSSNMAILHILCLYIHIFFDIHFAHPYFALLSELVHMPQAEHATARSLHPLLATKHHISRLDWHTQ